jgi:hypothetical protein
MASWEDSTIKSMTAKMKAKWESITLLNLGTRDWVRRSSRISPRKSEDTTPREPKGTKNKRGEQKRRPNNKQTNKGDTSGKPGTTPARPRRTRQQRQTNGKGSGCDELPLSPSDLGSRSPFSALWPRPAGAPRQPSTGPPLPRLRSSLKKLRRWRTSPQKGPTRSQRIGRMTSTFTRS